MRVVVTVGGFALLAVGALLLIPLPEAGIPAVLVGLRLLGRHYGWARTANDRLDDAVRAGRRRWGRLPRLVRVAVPVLLLVVTALVVYVLAT